VYQLTRAWPIGWVLENENKKEVVGHIGNIPLSYEFKGRQLLATTGHSLVVDSLYRAYSLRLLSHFFNQKYVDLFVNTTVNTQASRVYELFRARRVPVGAWDESWFWITNFEGFVASILTKNNLSFLQPLIYPMAIGFQLEAMISRHVIKAEEHGIEIHTCNGFDERFEQFWNKLKCCLHHQLLATRTREVLECHFQNDLKQNRAWVVTADDCSGIIAYGIFCCQDNVGLGLKRMRLADFQVLNGNTKLLAPMVAWASSRTSSTCSRAFESLPA
jgi:hypothetical protein